MILLTVEEVITLHEKLINRTGGSQGLRDKGLLESAIYSAMSEFDGKEAYLSVQEKAARLMYSITNNHPFVDGNKRIGVFTMLMTLQLNNIKNKYTQSELISLGLSVADGKMKYKEILSWIIEHEN